MPSKKLKSAEAASNAEQQREIDEEIYKTRERRKKSRDHVKHAQQQAEQQREQSEMQRNQHENQRRIEEIKRADAEDLRGLSELMRSESDQQREIAEEIRKTREITLVNIATMVSESRLMMETVQDNLAQILGEINALRQEIEALKKTLLDR